MNKVAVMGGGASGIMAAITAKSYGADVVLLEKNSRIGKKLLMTGNGRCNLTNMNIKAEDYNSDFVCDAISEFSPKDTVDFFKKAGLLTFADAENRVYPMSNQASAVLEILLSELKRREIPIICDFDVANIRKKNGAFIVSDKSGREVLADKLIAAFGGKAAASTGSDGSGYELLSAIGHSVTPIDKALVQLKTDRSIKGIRVNAVAMLNGKTERGEVQFTEYGLSGIPIFNLSRYAAEKDIITLDLLPDYTEEELFSYLTTRKNQKLETYLVGIINKQLGQMLLKECDLGKLSRESADLKDFEIQRITKKIKNWHFTVTGKMPWENAQITKGGIAVSEVSSKTMQSKLISGLYITGELLDVDAPCGGYNLQWAWSSGFAAGKAAAGE